MADDKVVEVIHLDVDVDEVVDLDADEVAEEDQKEDEDIKGSRKRNKSRTIDDDDEIKIAEDTDGSEKDEESQSGDDSVSQSDAVAVLDDEEEASVQAAIKELKQKVKSNSYYYDGHIELIKMLRTMGDLHELRKAREKMAEIFPLSEDLWLEWTKDEEPLVSIPQHKEYIIALYDKAVKDYASVKVWLAFCQFMMDRIEDPSSINTVRDVFERAITAVGFHVTEGSAIWDGYRDFEMTILDSYQQLADSQDSAEMDDKIENQIERVASVFKRQLAVPLLGMQQTWRAFEDWMTVEPISDLIDLAYNKAVTKVEQCLQFEDELSTAKTPKLAEYRNYISFEMKEGDPVRIQCIFERAIKDNCLQYDLWKQYTDYLDYQLKVGSVALPVHKRAVGNCPWVSFLWQNYLKALERNKAAHKTVKDVFNQALGCGFATPENYLHLWLTLCDYMKRRISDWESESEKVKDMKKTFKNAVQYMFRHFGADGDPTCILQKYRAHVEAKFLKNLREAQNLWDDIMKLNSRETHWWLEYTTFLRLHGDIIACRHAFQRAVQTNVDKPKKLFDAFIHFEREEGSLETYDAAALRCNNQLVRIAEKTQKESQRKEALAVTQAENEEKRKQTKTLNRAEKRKLQKTRKDQDIREDTRRKRREEHETRSPPEKKPKEEEKMDEDITEEGQKELDLETQERTVFLSNLLFHVTEDKIQQRFKDCGEISEIRLVKNQIGRSKGYAYLEFKDKESATKALSTDRETLDGRPVFVSPFLDKTKHQMTFRFPTALDKSTVFVTNLPFDSTADELKNEFATVGSIKDVRIVTNRAGKPKGYAYIEFTNEAEASAAVVKFDEHVIKDRNIKVALSHPPSRKPRMEDDHGQPNVPLPAQAGSRGRAKTQLAMMPRALHKPSAATTTPTTTPTETKSKDDPNNVTAPASKTTKMSNDDFRKLIFK